AVRPDEPSGAELGAAEVAGDDGRRVPHAAPVEHLEHGNPGRAARLAVVTGLLDASVGSEHIGVAVVRRRRVLGADPGDELLGLLLGGGGREGADEPGAADLALVHALARD